jgi:hypothetical protein
LDIASTTQRNLRATTFLEISSDVNSARVNFIMLKQRHQSKIIFSESEISLFDPGLIVRSSEVSITPRGLGKLFEFLASLKEKEILSIVIDEDNSSSITAVDTADCSDGINSSEK